MAGEEIAELEPELVLGLAFDGVEGVVVEDGGEALSSLLPELGAEEELDEVFDVGGVEHEVAAVDAEGGLDGDAGAAYEVEVHGPDAVVLGDGEGAEGAVEGEAGAGEELLVGEGLEVHDPDAGHLVHGDEGALEGVVEGGEEGVGDGEGADEVEALAEVGVPELVAAGEGFEGALVDDEALLERGAGAGDQVAPPELEAEGVAEDFFLVEEVVLARVQI